jgi:hypothetical protein
MFIDRRRVARPCFIIRSSRSSRGRQHLAPALALPLVRLDGAVAAAFDSAAGAAGAGAARAARRRAPVVARSSTEQRTIKRASSLACEYSAMQQAAAGRAGRMRCCVHAHPEPPPPVAAPPAPPTPGPPAPPLSVVPGQLPRQPAAPPVPPVPAPPAPLRVHTAIRCSRRRAANLTLNSRGDGCVRARARRCGAWPQFTMRAQAQTRGV